MFDGLGLHLHRELLGLFVEGVVVGIHMHIRPLVATDVYLFGLLILCSLLFQIEAGGLHDTCAVVKDHEWL